MARSVSRLSSTSKQWLACKRATSCVMRCSSEVGNAAGGVWEKEVMQSATSSEHAGASRTERQSTASNCGARRLPSKEASILLPMPPIPSSVTRRQRSCTIHCESSATSTSRPVKWLVSRASTRSMRGKAAVSSKAGAAGLAAGGKGRGTHPQGNELFEAFGFGVAEAGLPLRNGAPGDAQPLTQPRLRQADAGAQRQHQLTEGIVSLPVRVSLHVRSPLCVTQQSDTL